MDLGGGHRLLFNAKLDKHAVETAKSSFCYKNVMLLICFDVFNDEENCNNLILKHGLAFESCFQYGYVKIFEETVLLFAASRHCHEAFSRQHFRWHS